MIFPIGTISQSIDVMIVDDDGMPVESLSGTNFPVVTYSKAGPNASVIIPTVSLVSVTAAYLSGGVKKRGGGIYRLDLPDAVFSIDAKVTLWAEETDKRMIVALIEVSRLMSLVEADLIIDDSVTPWAEVHMLKGTGGIGVGTELLRRRLFSVGAANLTSVDIVVGQAKQ